MCSNNTPEEKETGRKEEIERDTARDRDKRENSPERNSTWNRRRLSYYCCCCSLVILVFTATAAQHSTSHRRRQIAAGTVKLSLIYTSPHLSPRTVLPLPLPLPASLSPSILIPSPFSLSPLTPRIPSPLPPSHISTSFPHSNF